MTAPFASSSVHAPTGWSRSNAPRSSVMRGSVNSSGGTPTRR
jgi:hypothetical protein